MIVLRWCTHDGATFPFKVKQEWPMEKAPQREAQLSPVPFLGRPRKCTRHVIVEASWELGNALPLPSVLHTGQATISNDAITAFTLSLPPPLSSVNRPVWRTRVKCAAAGGHGSVSAFHQHHPGTAEYASETLRSSVARSVSETKTKRTSERPRDDRKSERK